MPVGTATAASVVVVDADGAASPLSCDDAAAAPRTVTAALATVDAGGTVRVCPGTVVEPGQVVVSRDVTVRAFDVGRVPTVVPAVDTGTVGDDRGWWLVRRGVELRLRDLRLDGSGRLIHQAVRFRGSGEVRDVAFTDIAYRAAGPDRSGFGVVAFGDGPVVVSGSSFRRIGRVGALFFGATTAGSVFADNVYVGKGPGDHLDYGVEIGDGSRVRIEDAAISGALGEADGAVSAGVLVSTAFGGGAGLTLTGSRLAGNANGVFLDDDAGRGLGDLAIARNIFSNNAVLGVARSGPVAVAATCNWWGASDGPASAGGSGDGASPGIETVPFLTSTDTTGRCSADPFLTADVSELTVNEGSPARVTGTFAAGSAEPLTLEASTGTLATTGTNVGTWTWTATPTDGPGDGTTVTVAGDNGRTGATSFDLRVRNVIPSATFDAPSTAFTDHPFTLSVRSLTDASPVDRAAGLTVAFDCSDGSGFGAAGTGTSTECAVARGGRRTVRALIADKDGGTREFTDVVEVYSSDGDGAPDRSAAGTVADGGVVATGTGEATPLDPVVTRVRVPIGGEVTIEEGPPTVDSPPEHALLSWGAVVTAPRQTDADPTGITFRLDRDLLPGPLRAAGVLAVSVVMEGDLVPRCDADPSPALPCLARSWTSDDDAVLEVRTTEAGAFGFAVPTVACATGSTPATSFPDVSGTAHEAGVACAERWALVRGVGPGTYAPAGSVTRAQAASMIARLLTLAGVELAAEPEDRFTDDDGSVHELAIGQLAELGVMEGRTATTFAPGAALTRAQFASTLARAASVLRSGPLPAGPDRFVDDDGVVHEANIDAVAAAGLANGVSDDRFDPHGEVRRDQTASFLTRLLGLWFAETWS
ncbi:MAG: S-layer homology domain-containing protein [Actinobacteria bacterium]|nr:S-layer homology domain-containing protein [Actinomycetota bacterium]